MELKTFLEHGQQYFLPNLSIDIVIIGYKDGVLKCLLMQMAGKWLLPGGYVGRSETVEAAAQRILQERTGLAEPHLKFLSVFGDPLRKFSSQWKHITRQLGIPWNPTYWINDRFVTLTYYSLVDLQSLTPVKGAFDDAIGWFPLDALPEMWMDHDRIVGAAKSQLRWDIRHEHVTHNLLPEPFTMPELHRLHQTILGKPLDRSRFQKQMLATGRLERLPQRQKDSPGRNPYQYRIIDTDPE